MRFLLLFTEGLIHMQLIFESSHLSEEIQLQLSQTTETLDGGWGETDGARCISIVSDSFLV